MSCYFIAQINIRDQAEYDRYLKGFDEVFEQFRGTVVAVEDDPVVLEGVWPFTRTVLIRFPDKAEARRWYDSPGYRELVKRRHRAAKANIVLVEGFD